MVCLARIITFQLLFEFTKCTGTAEQVGWGAIAPHFFAKA